MSRAGYTEDCENNWSLICYRGAVKSAIRGKRGQAFLREMLAALDALPEKRLISGDLIFDGRPEFPRPDPHEDIIVGADQLITGRGETVSVGEVCAMGAVARARGIDVANVDTYDAPSVASIMGISEALAREIAWENDENWYGANSPEERFSRMRKWVVQNLASAEAHPQAKTGHDTNEQ